ncbi:MAG: CerR family C-terminal domain-containing protein [Acidobacteriia bacterium]|nr:CerR family C-terminal domain-containing protein [Terriglobia bacterium]
MRKQSRAQAETRRRLLEAAGELFAEKGFRVAATREICRKAGTDIAAIHYHFGNKENLYEAVLRYADNLLTDAVPDFSVSRQRSREARLRSLIEWVLSQCFAQGQPAWRWKFIEQATVELPPSLEAFFRSNILPMYQALDSICREFLGEGASQLQVRFATRSILGQCFYYRHFQALIRATEAGETFSAKGLHELTEHIVKFSLAGLKDQARQLKRKRVRPHDAGVSRARRAVVRGNMERQAKGIVP